MAKGKYNIYHSSVPLKAYIVTYRNKVIEKFSFYLKHHNFDTVHQNTSNKKPRSCSYEPLDKHADVECMFKADLDDENGVYIRYRTDGSLFTLRRLKAHTKTLNHLICELLYADDATLVAHTEVALQHLTSCFAEAAELFGQWGKKGFIVIQAEQPDFEYLILAVDYFTILKKLYPQHFSKTFGPFIFIDIKSGSPSKSFCLEEEEVEEEDCDLYERKCEKNDSNLAGKASGLERTLNKFADDTKVGGAVDSLEGREALQRDLNKSEDWAITNYLNFNKGKCWILLHLGWGNRGCTQRLGNEMLERSATERDLGVLVNDKLNVKSCLTNPVAFYDRVTPLVDKGRATDAICLNLCKAFDTVQYNTLVSKLKRLVFDRCTTWDMESGIETTLSEFANNTKFCGVVNLLEGRMPSRETLTGLRVISSGYEAELPDTLQKLQHQDFFANFLFLSSYYQGSIANEDFFPYQNAVLAANFLHQLSDLYELSSASGDGKFPQKIDLALLERAGFTFGGRRPIPTADAEDGWKQYHPTLPSDSLWHQLDESP
ncbi:hypothetical protein BTVI_157736 [Pitangus sulphuratus]|nr:hypothetical protein BTVI_157736 [Pitangus sulphuratus]